jgi:hypothetical protein
MEGLKVAMVIYTTKEPTQERALNYCTVSEEKWLHYCFGYADHTNIYTGEVVGVGDYHIEHNINTYCGFSGAVIFLLDNPALQQVHVDYDDFRKVIAVRIVAMYEYSVSTE